MSVDLATYFIGDPFNLWISLRKSTFQLRSNIYKWFSVRLATKCSFTVFHFHAKALNIPSQDFRYIRWHRVFYCKLGTKTELKNTWRLHITTDKCEQVLPRTSPLDGFHFTQPVYSISCFKSLILLHVKQFYLWLLTSNSFSFPVRVLHTNNLSSAASALNGS